MCLDGKPGFVSPVQDYIDQMHKQFADMQDGEVASYIPELSKANKNWFGICIATTDGQLYEVGTTRQQFTLQSVSKAFIYGLALEDHGKQFVLSKIGVEPSGDLFNSISLDPKTGCPLNPMINAGAIATTGLVKGESNYDKLQRILELFSRYVGHEVKVDYPVFTSEKYTGHRNRAIGYMLCNFGIIKDDPEPVLDLYFQQCSISVDCRDLAVMAATLANGGVNPITKTPAVKSEFVENILSVMSTCGMYDYAGEWIYRVGMPAKSGVTGGILAVLPGQLGIGVFSPPLDAHGNSVRGISVINKISKDFKLHFFNAPRSCKSVIRSKYDASQANSKRLRTAEESKILHDSGQLIKTFELQGELFFASVEIVIREIIKTINSTDYTIIDFRRVFGIDVCACKLLLSLLNKIIEVNSWLIFANTRNNSLLEDYIKENLEADKLNKFVMFDDNDMALEWCENKLIELKTPSKGSGELKAVAEYELCQGLAGQDINHLKSILKLMTFKSGDLIINKGEDADSLFFLAKGKVSVTISLPGGNVKRLTTFSPGMAFGEMAIIERSTRSADVQADTDVHCYALSVDSFDKLDQTNVNLKTTLLVNLARNLSERLRKANQEISALG